MTCMDVYVTLLEMESESYKAMIKRIVFVLIIICIFALYACKAEPAQSPVAEPEAPKNFTGGQALDNINAKELGVSGELMNGKYTITLKFVHGSRLASVDEAAASSVPSYNVSLLDSPQRLLIEFDKLDYWDYERVFRVEQDDPMLYGAFKVTDPQSGKFSLYLQLKRDCSFGVSASAGQLSITLEPKAEEEEPQRAYYVTVNAPASVREAALGVNGLTPVLCVGGDQILLISNPLSNESVAENLMGAISASLGSAVEGRMSIITLVGNELPAYNANLDYAEVFQLKPIRINGGAKTLEVAMPDGLYLCSTQDGRRHLFKKPLREDNGGDTESLLDIEELWILDKTGRSNRLTDFEFAAIEQAAFSPDGKRLAILERTADTSYLYIYDMDTNELSYNLGYEGFGSMTSNFVWDSIGSSIYAISGSEQLQLLKYDFTIPDETKRVSRVDENAVGDGDLGFFDGDLYFSDVSVQGGNFIYKIKPEGGLRSEYATGSGFRISPDNRYMAITESASLGGDDTETTDSATLTLKNIVTGETSLIVKDKFVIGFDWGYGGKLYYAVGENLETTDDEYPFTLFSVSPGAEPVEIASIMTPDFAPSLNENVMFLPFQDQRGGKNIKATFIWELGNQ